MRCNCASCQHFVFEFEVGVLTMDEERHEPSMPSDGLAVDAVDLTADDTEPVQMFQSFLQNRQAVSESGSPRLHTPQLDDISEGSLGGCDTSLVENIRDEKDDKAVSKREYESLLMTAIGLAHWKMTS